MSGKVVILAVDGSHFAEHAAKYYMENIHQEGNQIILVHVAEIPEKGHAREEFLSPHTLAELWKEEGVKAKGLEAKYKALLGTQAGELRMHIEAGVKPGLSICRAAEKEKASLIVIGSRGMGTIRRTIIGSVSDYVNHHSKCPVLVCREGESS